MFTALLYLNVIKCSVVWIAKTRHLKMRNLQKVEGKMNKKESVKLPDESLKLWSCCRLLWMCCEYGLQLPGAQTWLVQTGMEGEAFSAGSLRHLPEVRGNTAVLEEWASSGIFQDPFFKKNCKCWRYKTLKKKKKSAAILRLILPKAHNNCHGICWMKCCFIHSCNILCIYTTQSSACFCNLACIEKKKGSC